MARDNIETLTALGRASGVPQSTLQRFEKGTHQSLSLDHIERIARFFGTDPARLFEADLPHLPDPQIKTVMMVMEELTPRERGVVVAASTALLESKKKRG